MSIALVTGGASGIGAEIASRLKEDGFTPVLFDIDSDAVQKQAQKLDGDSLVVDICDSAAVTKAVDTVIQRHGAIDVLVNNAGIHMQELLIDTDDEKWRKIFDVNVHGCFHMCRAVGRHMMRRESGAIINVITKIGFGNPYSSAYMASKSAVWGMSLCLALEAATYQVRVNCVAPGHIGPGTGMEEQFRAKAQKLGMSWEDFEKSVWQSIPAGRWCRPTDVAAAVAYLASPQAQFVLGEVLNVTGGFSGYAARPDKKEL